MRRIPFPGRGDRDDPALVPALRPVLPRCQGAAHPGDRWFVDKTYVRVNGVWRHVYRAIDQHDQVIDVLVSPRRDAQAARRFFGRALRTREEAGGAQSSPVSSRRCRRHVDDVCRGVRRCPTFPARRPAPCHGAGWPVTDGRGGSSATAGRPSRGPRRASCAAHQRSRGVRGWPATPRRSSRVRAASAGGAGPGPDRSGRSGRVVTAEDVFAAVEAARREGRTVVMGTTVRTTCSDPRAEPRAGHCWRVWPRSGRRSRRAGRPPGRTRGPAPPGMFREDAHQARQQVEHRATGTRP